MLLPVPSPTPVGAKESNHFRPSRDLSCTDRIHADGLQLPQQSGGQSALLFEKFPALCGPQRMDREESLSLLQTEDRQDECQSPADEG